MIDFEAIESYLAIANNPPKVVELEKLITYDEMVKLAKYGSKISMFLESRDPSMGRDFVYELKCQKCGSIFQERGSKTALIEDLKNLNKSINKDKYAIEIICSDCRKKIDEQEKKDVDKMYQEFKEWVSGNTSKFIIKYLDPQREWRRDIKKTKQYTLLMRQIRISDEDYIADYIRAMDYYDFLKTPYWIAISNKKKAQAGYRCQMCGAKGVKLIVHHNNYNIHGKEHSYFNMRDGLIVLCDSCHRRFHDKLQEVVNE